jgi:hypothetical protein
LLADINRVTQELYGLINFGELRKKVGKVTEKNSQKLNELIYSGSTQIRARGKTWRVKTPVCRILRRINMFDGNTLIKGTFTFGFLVFFIFFIVGLFDAN